MKIAFSGYQKHLNRVMKQPWTAVPFPAHIELSRAQPNSSLRWPTVSTQTYVKKIKPTKTTDQS